MLEWEVNSFLSSGNTGLYILVLTMFVLQYMMIIIHTRKNIPWDSRQLCYYLLVLGIWGLRNIFRIIFNSVKKVD